MQNLNNNKLDRENVFGWDDKNKLYLQHATPQELIDFNIISREHWSEYYKFIIESYSFNKDIYLFIPSSISLKKINSSAV